MTVPLQPVDEATRLRALAAYNILDTPPDAQLDDLTALAAYVCQTPIALVSLVDAHRQWFKSKVGIEVSETPRDTAFCAYALSQSELLIVRDATADARFATNPLVTAEPYIRFYAGAPLETPEGQRLGTLCVIDRVPRDLSLAQQEALRALGRQVMAQLELRRHLSTQDKLIEQLQRAQQRLTDVHQQVELVLQSAGEGIYGLDMEGHITFVNAAAAWMSGYRVEELIGKPQHAIVHHARPDGSPYPREACPIYATLQDGVMRHVGTEVFWRQDGTCFPVEYISTPIRNELKELAGAVVTFRDITEHLDAVSALRVSEERFELAVSGSKDGLWDWNILTGEVYYSARLKELLGYANDEFPHVFASFENSLHPDDHAQVIQTVADHLQDRRPYDKKYRLRTKDGTFRWFRARGQAIWNEAGEPIRMAGSIRDITQRSREQEELRLTKELAEQANQAKSQFLANMSHELRTPLNAIMGYSEMLLEDVEELNNPQMATDLGKIISAGKHLLQLINEVLDLSKVEAGRVELFNQTFDVLTLVQETVMTIQPLVEQNANRLETHPAAALGVMHGDVTRIRQCLLNLFSNACKFTHQGVIRFDAWRETADEEHWIYLRVADTGIGMTPDALERAFEPFAQADASTTRKYGGTGLGLAITRRYCQLMGGGISVESEADSGSTFTIKLPARIGQGEIRQEVPDRPLPTGAERRGTVLVIDDDPAVQDLIGRVLHKEGFRTLQALSGAEGLRLARETLPCVITLDVIMPGMDGWDVLRALKDDPELRDIPVVMCTILDNKSRGFALGVSDYLAKPMDRERLIEVLARHCAGPAEGHVLLVEDDVYTREILTRTLQQEGWAVSAATNGRVALELMAQNRPALIILDLMMPEMDGFTFVAELRKTAAWRLVPIVVMTAKDLTPEDHQRLNGNVEAVIHKTSAEAQVLMQQLSEFMQTWAHRNGDERSDYTHG